MREIRVMKATTDEIAYWLQVAGRSEPMRAAHFFIQLKHALFGTKEERKECWRWLRGDRSFVCKYSYIHQSAVKAANLLVHLQTIKDISEVALGTIRFCESSNHLCVADGYSQDIPPEEWEKLMDIIDAYEGKSILVLPELIDWNIPLFQRPQQLAMAFAQMGILFIYFTPNGIDNIHSVKKIMGCCVLLPSDWFETTIAFLLQRKLDVILDIWSTDNKHFMPWINQLKERGCRILYEYTDEISESITGHVPQETLERHRSLLNDKETFVVATADKLYNDVLQIRGSGINCLNSSNGVDLKHFKVEDDNKNIPKNVKSIIQKKKPIIGYFGAIANWFDFELVAYAAKLRPEYEFMMIGPNYGSHDLAILDKLVKISNLHFVGSVDYKVLPYVAKSFTVATIPFKLNEITESTSPIKLFEYMAMGKPVVTTAMRECFKYPVVRIAKDKDDYVAALDELVGKAQDEQYLTKILDLAQQNSWSKKAEEIVRLLKIS